MMSSIVTNKMKRTLEGKLVYILSYRKKKLTVGSSLKFYDFICVVSVCLKYFFKN